MNYADGIRRARERSGLSKRKFALRVGFDPSFITHLEKGDRKPSLHALELFAKVAGISMVEIIAWSSERADLLQAVSKEAR